ncbi:MAG: hypothetical protein IKR72_03040 [Bacteroidales bacterium]|nr:hypothetical protein [Bacteroidales bacterium]
MKNLLLKPAFWLCAVLIALVVVCTIQHKKLVQTKEEAARLEDNQTSLLSQVEYYRSENGELVASVQSLTMRNEEIGALLPQYEKELKSLKIELRKAKSIAHVETETNAEIVAPIQPGTGPAEPVAPANEDKDKEKAPTYPREFSWSDDWLSVSGKIYPDTVVCSIVNRDSLLLVAHYAKRKCLFFKGRKGKLLKYDVKTKNPHTEIKGLEFIEVIE